MTDNQHSSENPTPDSTTGDLVAQSVAAYTEHVDDYEAFNADMVATQLLMFLTDLNPGSLILDAGCGPGRDLERMTKAGHSCIGVDLNDAFLTKASRFAPVQHADLRDLPFIDDQFDAAWACASLVHLPEDDAAKALSELNRVTEPGGRVYVSVKHAGETGWTDTAHGRRFFQIWSPDSFVDAVADAGMKVDNVVVGPVFVDVWAYAGPTGER